MKQVLPLCDRYNTPSVPQRQTVVRPATLEDASRIVTMGLRFIAETQYHALITPNPTAMRALVDALITGDRSIVLVSEREGELVGMIGLLVYPHPMSGLIVGVEAFFYVDAKARGSAGVRLLKAAMRWVQEQGATSLQMIEPFGSARVARLYQALGFVPVETTWQLRLGGS